MKVSTIGFGAWGIGGTMWRGSDDEQALAAIKAALDSGCTFIDTALAYGEGHSERLIAQARAKSKGHFTVATKVPPLNGRWPARKGVPLSRVFPAAYVRGCALRSAENLGQAPDLLQLHVWQDAWLDEPGWHEVEDTVASLIKEGTIRHFGISINDHDPASALEAVRRCELISSVQVIYNVFDQSPEERLFPLCRERNVGVIARVPLDEGGLTGAIGPDTKFPRGDWRNQYFAGSRKAEVAERVEKLTPLLKEEAGSLVEGAIRFCLSHEAVTTVIPGMRTAEHARANCRLGDAKPLSPSLRAKLKAHAWPRNWYAEPGLLERLGAAPALVVAILSLAFWIFVTFIAPLGAGWIHLFLAVGVLLLVRWVVTGPLGE